jgi:hypothetical protein
MPLAPLRAQDIRRELAGNTSRKTGTPVECATLVDRTVTTDNDLKKLSQFHPRG